MKTILSSRRDHYLAKASIFLVMVALIAGMAGCDGYTPPSQNLEIRTWYDLDAVRGNLTGSYILMNNLDSTIAGYEELASPSANQGKSWEPIGWGAWATSAPGCIRVFGEIFKGTLDGQGYEIRDLYINSEGLVGLFGFVAEEGIIKNIALINATVTTGEAARGPVGLNEDTVRCFDIGTVTAVGGLVGYNGGTVSNCYAMGNVTGGWNVGGLVGRNDGTVSNCYAMGNVTGDSDVGGLVGSNFGTVRNSYSTCSVNDKSDVGGLVGYGVEYHVDDSFWNTETSGQSTSAGGTGKTTAELKNIGTFTGAGWNIVTVANPDARNTTYTWNIVNEKTYPFLSW
jgi:hypothetical protein